MSMRWEIDFSEGPSGGVAALRVHAPRALDLTQERPNCGSPTVKFCFTRIDITADGGSPEAAVAVTLGLPTSPGPFQLIVADVPGIGTGAYPNVLPPACVIPSSILLHTSVA